MGFLLKEIAFSNTQSFFEKNSSFFTIPEENMEILRDIPTRVEKLPRLHTPSEDGCSKAGPCVVEIITLSDDESQQPAGPAESVTCRLLDALLRLLLR